MDKQDRVGGIEVSIETDRSRLHNAAAFSVKPAVTWFGIKRHAALLPLRPHPSYFLPRSPRHRHGKTCDNDLPLLNDHGAESDFNQCENHAPSRSTFVLDQVYAKNEDCAVKSRNPASNFAWGKGFNWDYSVNSVRRSRFRSEDKVNSYCGQGRSRYSFDFYRDDSDILERQDFRQLSRSKAEEVTSSVNEIRPANNCEPPSFNDKHSNSLTPPRSTSDRGKNVSSALQSNPPSFVWESDKGELLCKTRFQGSCESDKEHFDDITVAQKQQQRQQHNSVSDLSSEPNPSTFVCYPKIQAELLQSSDRRTDECYRYCDHSCFQSAPSAGKKSKESVNCTLTKTRTDSVIDILYFSNERCRSSSVPPRSEHLIPKSDRNLSEHKTHVGILSATSPSREALSNTLKNRQIPNSSYVKLLGTNNADSGYSSRSTSPSTNVDSTTPICTDSHIVDGTPSDGGWKEEVLGNRLRPSAPRHQFDQDMNPFTLQQGLAMGNSDIPAATFGIDNRQRVQQTTDGHRQPTQNATHDRPIPSAHFRQSEWPVSSAISGQNQSMFSMFPTVNPGTSERSKASSNNGENRWPLYSMNQVNNEWMLSLANFGNSERSISSANSAEYEQPLNLSEQGHDKRPLLTPSAYPVQQPADFNQGSNVSRTSTSRTATADPNSQLSASRQDFQGTFDGKRKRPADSDKPESQVTYPPSKRTNAGFHYTQNSFANPTTTDENENLNRKQDRLSSQPRPPQPQPHTADTIEQRGVATANGIFIPGVYGPGYRQNLSNLEVPKPKAARGRGSRGRRGRGAATGRGKSNVNGEERLPLPHPMSLPTINGVWPELLMQQNLALPQPLHQMPFQQPNRAELPHPMPFLPPHPLAFPMPHPMSLAYNPAQALSTLGLQHYGRGELYPMGIASHLYPSLGYPDPMTLALQHFYSENLDILGLGSQGNGSQHPGTNGVAPHQHRLGDSTYDPSCAAPEGLASQRKRARKSEPKAEVSKRQHSEQRKEKASQQSQSAHSGPNGETTRRYRCLETEPKGTTSTQHHQENIESEGVHPQQRGLADPVSRKPINEPSHSESRNLSSREQSSVYINETKDQHTSKPRSQPTSEPRIYPTSEPRIYPTGEPRIYPTSESRIQQSCKQNEPTNEPRSQPTCKVKSPPTSKSVIHPSRGDDSKLRLISEPFSQQFDRPPNLSSSEVNQPESESRSQSGSEVKPSSESMSRFNSKVKQDTNEPMDKPTREPNSQKSSEPRSCEPIHHPNSQSRSKSCGEVNQPNSEPTIQPRNQLSDQVNQPTSEPRSQPTSKSGSQPAGEPRNQSSDQVNQPAGEQRSPSTSEPRSQSSDQVNQPVNIQLPQPVIKPLFQSGSQRYAAEPTSQPLPCELPFRLSSDLLPAYGSSTTDDSLSQQELGFKEWREKALRMWQEKIDRIPFFTTGETPAPDHPQPVKPKPPYLRVEGKECSCNQNCCHHTADPDSASIKLQHEATKCESETDICRRVHIETCHSQSEMNRYDSQAQPETNARCSPQNSRGQGTETHDSQTDNQSATDALRYVPETVQPAVKADRSSRHDAEVHGSQTNTNQLETGAHCSQQKTNKPHAEVHYSQQQIKQEVHSSLPGMSFLNTEAHSSKTLITQLFSFQPETGKQDREGYCPRSETTQSQAEPTFCFQQGRGQTGADWYHPQTKSDRLTTEPTSCYQQGSGQTRTQQYCPRAETNKLELETAPCSQLGTSNSGTEPHRHPTPTATQPDREPVWPPLQVQTLFDTLMLPQRNSDDNQVVNSGGNTLAYNSSVHVEDISP